MWKWQQCITVSVARRRCSWHFNFCTLTFLIISAINTLVSLLPLSSTLPISWNQARTSASVTARRARRLRAALNESSGASGSQSVRAAWESSIFDSSAEMLHSKCAIIKSLPRSRNQWHCAVCVSQSRGGERSLLQKHTVADGINVPPDAASKVLDSTSSSVIKDILKGFTLWEMRKNTVTLCILQGPHAYQSMLCK